MPGPGQPARADSRRAQSCVRLPPAGRVQSPTGWNQLWSDVRVAQAEMGLAVLDRSPGDVLWLG